jgi:hypothetical protein
MNKLPVLLIFLSFAAHAEWQLVHTESQYREYIRKEVKACLEEKCL